MTQLDNILDEVQGSSGPEASSTHPAEDQEQALYEEHAARIRAEAEASSAQRRFLVASQQIAEYLVERAADVRAASTTASGLREAGAPEAQVEALQAALSTTAADLDMTAGHFRSECEAAKRSLAESQPGGAELSSPKRKRGTHMDVDAGPSGSQRGEESEEEDEEDEEATADGSRRDGSSATHLDSKTNATASGPGATPADNGTNPSSTTKKEAHDTFRERAKHIPLRLDAEERRLLRLLEAALSVSEYTDKVDVLSWRSKTARVHAQVKDICAVLCGLVVAQDYKRGQRLIAQRDFASLADFFRDVFEVGRRHKVMNPERMRDTYGKLVYMLMDASEPEIQDLLEFDPVRPLRTVHTLLDEAGKLDLLDDPLLETATAEIAAPPGAGRAEIQRRIRAKERARGRWRGATAARRYRKKTSCAASTPSPTTTRSCCSTATRWTACWSTCAPASRPAARPARRSRWRSRAAPAARALTHSHDRQFAYVLQSLMLWREISHEMFKLWHCADADMLEPRNYYRLQNTGQGLQRVQAAPRVSRAMGAILARCQRRLGSWVGSSVVHLGDHNVPNALVFIDKYTQVPRILGPLALVLERLPRLAEDRHLARYLEAVHGSAQGCRHAILHDFFKHAFDGSGADNFFDAGSCIDGRLTSAWNWCAKLEKKPYYHIFSLAGFQGFDGDFK
ncbi:hypothetical protein QBZ16_001091 [Prototheca wickerhamii]|uniref:Non-canonical E2 ubiquitin-conjugating enzyme C-terminal domain-containing protein n=1 Tax=Prototheca wickerhamii TaxID=3111 RepID=A0AAD9IDL8_PROWI|nr:hypothetical protein QBZ16_001091 [Prototheca wickerhamii]